MILKQRPAGTATTTAVTFVGVLGTYVSDEQCHKERDIFEVRGIRTLNRRRSGVGGGGRHEEEREKPTRALATSGTNCHHTALVSTTIYGTESL